MNNYSIVLIACYWSCAVYGMDTMQIDDGEKPCRIITLTNVYGDKVKKHFGKGKGIEIDIIDPQEETIVAVRGDDAELVDRYANAIKQFDKGYTITNLAKFGIKQFQKDIVDIASLFQSEPDKSGKRD